MSGQVWEWYTRPGGLEGVPPGGFVPGQGRDLAQETARLRFRNADRWDLCFPKKFRGWA